MALADIATQYIIIIWTTLLFSVLAIMENELNGKNVILQYFAGVLWILSGFAHFIAGEQTSALTFAVSYLFYGFATIFIVAAFYNTLMMVKMKRKPSI